MKPDLLVGKDRDEMDNAVAIAVQVQLGGAVMFNPCNCLASLIYEIIASSLFLHQ